MRVEKYFELTTIINRKLEEVVGTYNSYSNYQINVLDFSPSEEENIYGGDYTIECKNDTALMHFLRFMKDRIEGFNIDDGITEVSLSYIGGDFLPSQIILPQKNHFIARVKYCLKNKYGIT